MGAFSGSPKSQWLDDGLKMKLLEDFTYSDRRKKRWWRRGTPSSMGRRFLVSYGRLSADLSKVSIETLRSSTTSNATESKKTATPFI
jgi:hypothetical protein